MSLGVISNGKWLGYLPRDHVIEPRLRHSPVLDRLNEVAAPVPRVIWHGNIAPRLGSSDTAVKRSPVRDNKALQQVSTSNSITITSLGVFKTFGKRELC